MRKPMTAWVNGFLGVVLCWGIGTWVLELSLAQILQCIAASIVAGLVALLSTLKGERTPWLRRSLLRSSLGTWSLFLTLYFGLMIWAGKPLHQLRNLGWLVIPLILTTGFTILIFGPIQDQIVARMQRRSRGQN